MVFSQTPPLQKYMPKYGQHYLLNVYEESLADELICSNLISWRILSFYFRGKSDCENILKKNPAHYFDQTTCRKSFEITPIGGYGINADNMPWKLLLLYLDLTFLSQVNATGRVNYVTKSVSYVVIINRCLITTAELLTEITFDTLEPPYNTVDIMIRHYYSTQICRSHARYPW